ncbi:exo-alpha-sialidase [Methyloglobulus sp.]|uniref:sialidase family protein n=1 Tax=Methyloglobulus sp. TaxID=2518622 RepID=UPI0039895633
MVRQTQDERNQLITVRPEPVEGHIQRLFMFSTVISYVGWVSGNIWSGTIAATNPTYIDFLRITVQNLAVFPTILICSLIITINGCSSGLLLGIVEPTAGSTMVAPYSKSTFGLFDISTFDVYVDDDIIHGIVGGKISANEKNVTIRYTRSEDGGRHWNDPVVIGDLPATIASRGNDIQLAAKGNHLLAVWQTKGELPGMGPMVSAYSQDNGKTWKQAPNPAVNNAGDQSHIDLIADQHDNFHAVWLEDPEENGYQSLRYARSLDWGKRWNQAATLDDSTCSCCWNTFALSPEGELNILYRDMEPRDMSLLQSSDDGKTWQHISTVGEFDWKFDGCPHVGGSLAYLGTDNPAQLHSLVWTGAEQKSGLYHLSSNNNGKSWSTPQKLGNTAIHGDIAGLDGNLVVLWDEMEPDGSSIFYAKSEDAGTTWLTPTRLTTASNAATHPRLIATGHGLLALWTEKPSKQPRQLAWQLLE